MGKLVFFVIGHKLLMDFDLCSPTRLVFFYIDHILLVDFDLYASTRLVFLTLVSHCWWILTCALPSSLLFDIGQSQLVDFDLYGPTRLVFFDIGHLLMNFDLCASTRLLFLTFVSHCLWTLTCALPLVLSFLHWSSVTVGGLWIVRSHSSCLFHTGQTLLVDFDLCAPTRLISLTLVNHCCWTSVRSCAPTHPTRLFFFTLVSHNWWTWFACALPLVFSV